MPIDDLIIMQNHKKSNLRRKQDIALYHMEGAYCSREFLIMINILLLYMSNTGNHCHDKIATTTKVERKKLELSSSWRINYEGAVSILAIESDSWYIIHFFFP